MLIGLALFKILYHPLSPPLLLSSSPWDNLISTGYECENYDIVDA